MDEGIVNIVTLDKDVYIDKMMKSYRSDEEIVRQFSVDFYREKIYINGYRCVSIDHFMKLIIYYSKDNIQIKDQNISPMLFAMLLCCQSSFYDSYYNLFDQINKLKLDNSTYESYNVCHGCIKNKIYFIIGKNIFECKLLATYKIVDINTDKIVQYIRSQTILNVFSNNNMIYYY